MHILMNIDNQEIMKLNHDKVMRLSNLKEIKIPTLPDTKKIFRLQNENDKMTTKQEENEEEE